MWSNPSLYRKYKAHDITKDTFTSDTWYFYFRLGEAMWGSGVRTFDEETTVSYVSSQNNPKLLKDFEKHGFYDTVGYVKGWCKEDKQNEEYHLSEIQKFESLRYFANKGLIDTTNKELVNKLASSTLTKIKTYFNHQFKSGFKNINSGQVEFVDLVDEEIYDEIDEMKKGVNMGVPLFHAPRLTKTIKGWKEGKMGYLVMPSGTGKSTLTRAIFIMTLIESNKKGLALLMRSLKLLGE